MTNILLPPTQAAKPPATVRSAVLPPLRPAHTSHRPDEKADLPCPHRGGLLGQLDCACGGKPAVLVCALHGRCVRHAPGKPPPYKFVPLVGAVETLDSEHAPAVCARCLDGPHGARLVEARAAAGTVDPPAAGMQWTTTEQFLTDSMSLARKLSSVWPLKGVLGVPRSGQRVAAIVAGELQCPTGWVDDHDLQWFHPSHSKRVGTPETRPGTVIVIDDSSATGGSLGRAVDTARRKLGGDILSAVLYQFATSRFHADYAVRKFAGNAAWAWHEYYVCGSEHATTAAWDMDGLLCPNPTLTDMASETSYWRFLRDTPCIRPVRPFAMGAIITGRCERFRGPTENWLARHGMQTRELVMHPDVPLLTGPPGIAQWKADRWRERPGLRWFLESEPDLARQLSEAVGRPAVCVPTGQVFERGKANP